MLKLHQKEDFDAHQGLPILYPEIVFGNMANNGKTSSTAGEYSTWESQYR